MMVTNDLVIHELADWFPDDMTSLSALLTEVVADGASIGFLPPLSCDDAMAYWQSVPAPTVRVWVARRNGEIVGSIQLHLSPRQNGLHRAEIAKLMVHPNHRRLGTARLLMSVAEQSAIQANRSLLVLDTRAGDPSNELYRSLGFVEAGRIPQYARSADGKLDASIFYYKLLTSDVETR